MAYHVSIVRFVNNSLKIKDSVLLIDSIERHQPNLLELNFSKNELGLDGAKKLASRLPMHKKLKTLILANCNMGDRGSIEIVTALLSFGPFFERLFLISKIVFQFLDRSNEIKEAFFILCRKVQ